MTTLDQSLTGPSTLAHAARRLLPNRDVAFEGVLDLGANTARSFPRSRGLLVEVLEGSVLFTQSGDPDDHVLGAGDRARFDGRGVAAMAFTPARLRIRAGAAAETVPQSLPWNGATFGSSSR